MNLKGFAVFFCVLAALVDLGITLTLMLGWEIWFTHQKLYMSVFHPGIGLETVAGSETLMLFFQLLLMLIVLFLSPLILKKMWNVCAVIFYNFTKKSNKKQVHSHDTKSVTCDKVDPVGVIQVKKCKDKALEISFDYKQIQKMLKTNNLEYIEVVIPTDK
ncbi:hypothetical protein ScPMuIL_012093 [Solemya velum]